MVIEIHHPSLGRVIGKGDGNVAQFRGLKYGFVTGRFDASQVAKSASNSGNIDATEYGPSPVFPSHFFEMESNFIQKTLDVSNRPPVSETEGLNLNITVPWVDGKGPGCRLPVLVYIHGGGFMFGSSWYPHYNQAKIVQLSITRNTPVVAVNINYRLGIAGFLTSAELRDAGFPPNNGLNDQKTALRWLRENVAGFGGDPENMTVIGQSAGAAAVGMHLYGAEPLFKKAVLLGGTPLVMGPMSQADAEMGYNTVVRSFGLDRMPKEDRIQALNSISSQEIISKVSPEVQLGPVIDGELDTILTFEMFDKLGDHCLRGKNWCEELFILSSEMDGSIITNLVLLDRVEGIAMTFREFMTKSFGQEKSQALEALLRHYELEPGMHDLEALMRITRLISDLSFLAPSIAFASAWPKSYLGRFVEGNPFEGLFAGQASHMLDIAYLWQNYRGHLSDQQAAVGLAFAEDILGFVVGDGAGIRFNGDKMGVMYGPSDLGRVKSQEPWAHSTFFKLIENLGGLDAVTGMVNRFLYTF